MTDEFMQQLKPEKPESRYSPLRLVGILSLIAFMTVLIIVGTFTRLKVINCFHFIEVMMHPALFPEGEMFALKAYFYAPQIPVILFSVALLGTACSLTSVLLYIIIGLTLMPVFALGGGLNYVFEPTFGYILACLPAVLIAGFLIDKDHSIFSLLKAAFFGVLTVHVLGFVYMLLVAVIRHENFTYIMDWLLFESVIKSVYDFSIGFLLMLVAKFFRKFIWILTSI